MRLCCRMIAALLAVVGAQGRDDSGGEGGSPYFADA